MRNVLLLRGLKQSRNKIWLILLFFLLDFKLISSAVLGTNKKNKRILSRHILFARWGTHHRGRLIWYRFIINLYIVPGDVECVWYRKKKNKKRWYNTHTYLRFMFYHHHHSHKHNHFSTVWKSSTITAHISKIIRIKHV